MFLSSTVVTLQLFLEEEPDTELLEPHLDGLQWTGKENGHLPDDRSEEAVKATEEPNTLRQDKQTNLVKFSDRYIKCDSY